MKKSDYQTPQMWLDTISEPDILTLSVTLDQTMHFGFEEFEFGIRT